jgi:S1-C subfamily serine protease
VGSTDAKEWATRPRTASGYIFLIACLLFPANYRAESKAITVKTIQEITRSVVPIICGYTDDKNVYQLAGIAGSGFFVDDQGRFVTPSHVLDVLQDIHQKSPTCMPAIYVADHGWQEFEPRVHFQYFNFVGCTRNPNLDLAVCQPIENPFTSPRLTSAKIKMVEFDSSQWPEGTSVAFTGFPLQSVRPITSIGSVAGYMDLGDRKDAFDIVIDKAAWPGASGSPLYVGNGKVIGIILRRGKEEGSGLAFARSASLITEFLSQNPPTKEQKK